MRSTIVLSALVFAVASAKAQATAGTPVYFTFGNGPTPGPCFVADGDSDGAAVRIAPCPVDPQPVDSGAWIVVNGGASGPNSNGPAGPINIFVDKCLDVKDGRNANGAQLQIWTCSSGNPNQQFNVNGDNTIVWSGKGKCVDLPSGNTATGTQLQVWDCFINNPNQKWTPVVVEPTPVRRAPVNVPVALKTFLISPRFAPCITATGDYSGAPVVISTCTSPSSAGQKWTVVKGGAYESTEPNPGPSTQIKTFDGNMCLDLTDGNTTPGNQLQVWACSNAGTNPNQQWSFWGDSSIELAGNPTLSVSLLNGNFTDGTPIVINTKDVQQGQGWNAVSPNN